MFDQPISGCCIDRLSLAGVIGEWDFRSETSPIKVYRERGSGQWRGYSKSLPGESIQPRIDYGTLVSGYLFNKHAHAENAQAAAGMQVDHLAV